MNLVSKIVQRLMGKRQPVEPEFLRLPPGAKINRYDDDMIDIEVTHDPWLNRWWFSKRLNGFGFPIECLKSGKYRTKLRHRNMDGNWVEDEFVLPFGHGMDWEPSEKPSNSVVRESAKVIANRLLDCD